MYKELCRLCGNKNNETLDIFSELGSNQKLELKIKEVVRLNILKEDPLPNIVCVLCIKHLENASYFIDHCHQTQTYLNQLYQDSLSQIHISNLLTLNDTENQKHDVSKTTDVLVHCTSIDNCNQIVSEDHKENKTDQKLTELTNILNTELQDDSFGAERIIFGKVPTVNQNSNNSSNDTDSTNLDSQIKTILQTYSSNTTNDPISNKDNSDDEINERKGSANDSLLRTILQCNTSNTSNDRSQLKIKCTSEEIPIINQNRRISITIEGNSSDENIHKRNDLSDDIFGFDSTDDDEEYESSSLTLRKDQQKPTVSKMNLKENDTNRKDFQDKKRFYCATCKKTFSQELTYQEHLNVHTGNRPFSCKLCTASFRRRQELNQHLRTVHSEKQLKCPSCDHVAKHKGKLTEHIKSVHDKPFACDMCSYRTGEKGKIQQHIANKHTTNLSYICEVCGNGFKTKNSLQVHIRNIHFPEPKVCQTCGTLCSSLAKYSSHIFRCGKEKKRYQCEKCDKSYVNKEILRDHMNHHLNVKPYKCGICGKAFFQRSRLDMHKFVHRGANYQCEICNQFFNRKDNMKNHMKRHFYKSMRCDNTIVTAV